MRRFVLLPRQHKFSNAPRWFHQSLKMFLCHLKLNQGQIISAGGSINKICKFQTSEFKIQFKNLNLQTLTSCNILFHFANLAFGF